MIVKKARRCKKLADKLGKCQAGKRIYLKFPILKKLKLSEPPCSLPRVILRVRYLELTEILHMI